MAESMKRREIIRIRISEEDNKIFEELAKLSGLSLASWSRERLIKASRKEFDNYDEPPELSIEQMNKIIDEQDRKWA